MPLVLKSNLPARRSLLSTLAIALALLPLTSCRQGKRSKHPQDDWAHDLASSLEAKVARNPQDAAALRDLTLLRANHLPDKPGAKTFAPLAASRTLDPLAAYALALRSARAKDMDSLLVATKALLAANQEDATLASIALSWLWDELQDQPSRTQVVQELLTSFPPQTLSPTNRRALLSLSGKSDRLDQRPYRQAYAQQGCVQNWVAGPLRGHLGDLSLSFANLQGPGFKPEPDAPVFPLACAVRVWNPTPHSGYRRLQSDLVLKKQGLALTVTTPEVARVLLDGQEIWRRDTLSKIPPQTKAFRVDAGPGVHRLEVALDIPASRAWMLVRATDLNGEPVQSQTPSSPVLPAQRAKINPQPQDLMKRCRAQLSSSSVSDPRLVDPYIAHCALHSALVFDDWEQAHPALVELGKHKRFAPGLALLADAQMQNPERGRHDRENQASKLLARATKRDPSLLELSLAMKMQRIDRGEQEKVHEVLKKAAPPTHVADALFRAQVFLEVGDELAADAMLKRAQSLDPKHCEVTAARFARARDIDARQEQEALLPKLVHCSSGKDLALRFWMGRGDMQKAQPLVNALLEQKPDSLNYLQRAATIAQHLGQDKAFRAYLGKVIALSPGHVGAHMALADQDRSMGHTDKAKARLVAMKNAYAHQNGLRRILETLGEPDELLKERVSGKTLVQAYERRIAKTPIFEQDASVFVLDRDVVHVYDDGTQRHLVHQIIRTQNKEAIDAFGEIKVPEGAELLTLRTIKPDGRMIDPELVEGKSTYSMRALEVGDYVEQEWIMPAKWAQVKKGRVDLGAFRFASTQAPFVRSELIIEAPDALSLVMQEKGNPPQPKVQKQKGRSRWQFVAKDMPRVIAEPSSRAMQDELPSVRTFANLSEQEWLAALVQRMRYAQRQGPTLRSAIARWKLDPDDPNKSLAKIWRKVQRKVEPEGDLARSAAVTLQAGKGNRTTLMAALLAQAKIPARILVARSRFAPVRDPKGHPQFEDFNTPILEIWPDDPGKRRYLMADLEAAPIGFLPEWFEGAQAFVLEMDKAPEQMTTIPVVLGKSDPKVADDRKLALEIALDAQGNAQLKGSVTLTGFQAAQWRNMLQQADLGRRQELFSGIELARMLPFAPTSLEDLKFENLKVLQKPLIMRFEASASGVAKARGKTLDLPLKLVSMNAGQSLATLDKRKMGMIVPISARQSAKIQISLPQKFELAGSATALSSDLKSPYGRFERKVSSSAQTRRLSVELRTHLTPQIVEPADYPAFLKFVQSVTQAQSQSVHLSPVGVARATGENASLAAR